MADKSQLEIEIAPDGRVRITTHGLKGEACLAETRDLERALGKVETRAKTREYYEQAATTKQQVKRR